MSYISENFGDEYRNDRLDEMKWDYQLERIAADREVEENAGEEKICGWCSGSGEGMHESQRCRKCKGSGVV